MSDTTLLADQQNFGSAPNDTVNEQEDGLVRELVLLVPTQKMFTASISEESASLIVGDFYELPLSIPSAEAVQDVKSLILDSPEGFWMGAFGLESVVADELESEGDNKKWGPWQRLAAPEKSEGPNDAAFWRYTLEGVLEDYAEVGVVFAGSEAGKRYGLKVVPTQFASSSASAHIQRVRDASTCQLPFAIANGAKYEPSALSISPGYSFYPELVQESTSELIKKKSAESTSEATPHAFSEFTLDDLKTSTYVSKLSAAGATAQSSTLLKLFGLSAWNPVPHQRRVQGDLIYLTITTLEGELFQITCSNSGFWINKSSNITFDPTPKSPLPKGLKKEIYHSLFELISHLSAGFTKGLDKLMEAAGTNQVLVFANTGITHAIPAAPWRIPAPVHSPDIFRTQLAYLLTGASLQELLPPARDWNDELVQFRELPQTNGSERLLRERLISRAQADFTSSACRGVLSIARGDVPPINPNEPPEIHTYHLNGMLFTRTDDESGVWAGIGGREASRVGAAKDVAGVMLLESYGIEGANTSATVVVDYAGSRWTVQSVIPGLFKSKEPEESEEAELSSDVASPGVFRITYGSADLEVPDNKIRASPKFEQLAEKVAKASNFAKHSVIDKAGNTIELYTSVDMHGIVAADGKNYFIDCFRMHCVDVEFLEKDIEGVVYSENGESSSDSAYPHRLVLIRSEMLQRYRDHKLNEWIRAKTAEIRARQKPAAVEDEIKDAIENPVTEAQEAEATVEENGNQPTIIPTEDFELFFNPDAFVERVGKEPSTHFDGEEESSKNVRDASIWMRKEFFRDFLVELISTARVIVDGSVLTGIMHRAGINMRYLGYLVHMLNTEKDTLEFTEMPKGDLEFYIGLCKDTMLHEMVVRASKHILRRELGSARSSEHPRVISHFFNCLLGSTVEPKPVAEATGESAWASLTPESVQASIRKETESRFRYILPDDFFSDELNHVVVLRSICLRVGIQIANRTYNFTTRPITSSEDEAPVSQPAASTTAKKTKKKKAASGPKVEISSHLSFYPEDVLALYPLARSSAPPTKLADENFEVGFQQLNEGQWDVGGALTTDGISILEQINGAIHPLCASKYHRLGTVYHQLYQMSKNRINTSEIAKQRLAELELVQEELTPEQLEAKKRLEELVLAEPELIQALASMHLNSAIRYLQQGVVISERINGLDTATTIQYYIDLAFTEEAAGKVDLALKLLRHAIDLMVGSYGPKHPKILDVLNQVVQFVQTREGSPVAGVPIAKLARELSESIHGPRSIHTTKAIQSIAESYALSGLIGECIPYAKEAHELLVELLGTDAKEAEDMGHLIKIVEASMARETQEQSARADRLKKKFPKLMADKDIAARVSTPTGTLSFGSAPQTVAPSQPKVDSKAKTTPKSQYGSKAKQGLSVDELVNYIQGTSSQTPKKTTATKSPKAPKKRAAKA